MRQAWLKLCAGVGALFLLLAAPSGVFALSGGTLGTFWLGARLERNGITYAGEIPTRETLGGHRFLDARISVTLADGTSELLCEVQGMFSSFSCFAYRSLGVTSATATITYQDANTGLTNTVQSGALPTARLLAVPEHEVKVHLTVPAPNASGQIGRPGLEAAGPDSTPLIQHVPGARVDITPVRSGRAP